jgi:hypothetical protein
MCADFHRPICFYLIVIMGQRFRVVTSFPGFSAWTDRAGRGYWFDNVAKTKYCRNVLMFLLSADVADSWSNYCYFVMVIIVHNYLFVGIIYCY